MFAALDWTSHTFITYLALGGAVVVALSLGLYAIPGSRVKVPGIALSIVGGLGLGTALGMLLMGVYGLRPENAANAGAGPVIGGIPVMGGGAPGGGGGGPGGGGGRGSVSKTQLATLVGKVDVLTEKPLALQLTDEQRQAMKEQLKGLADAEDLSDDDAKAKVDKLHELLKDQKATLEAAGYRWPGQGGGGGGGPGGGAPQPPPNPFKVEQNAKHLKALTERLDKGAKG